jgi:uncharacterized membrane protein YebE (DUF533 family)
MFIERLGNISRLGMLLVLISLVGCAHQEYEHYAKTEADIARYEAQTAQATLAMFSKAMANSVNNEAVQGMIAMAQAMYVMLRKSKSIQMPQPSPIEVGIGAAIPDAVQWGGIVGMMLAGQSGRGGASNTTTYQQSISGSGSSGVIGSGSGVANTAPPTVVTQPAPIVIQPPSE